MYAGGQDERLSGGRAEDGNKLLKGTERYERMLFNSPKYMVFLPIVIFIYYCLPKRFRYIWLLAVSYYFYMQWSPLHVLLLFPTTAITYLCGRIIDGIRVREKESTVPRLPEGRH